jgi:hypothetical protein
MVLPTQALLALVQLIGEIQENQSLDPPGGQDPLVAHGLQIWQYIGIVALAVFLVAAVGFFSPRVEYAIYFAIFLSIILITFFFFL